ncbi:MAG TPA: extracellular solute-binding protein [Opitutaceae bacterium]|nr:extracellular solute-binding protein [Opitutaceae bacterium]
MNPVAPPCAAGARRRPAPPGTARRPLRGITWDHPRGYQPLEATARHFAELHPGVEIAWDRRPLRAFEEASLGRLAADYDLIVLDHPFVGEAARHRLLLPLDVQLPAGFLADQAANAVGASHACYAAGGHQWALAIDAAAPVAFWRDDLLAPLGPPPRTWDEVIALARRGHVEVPAAPVNCLMNFYALCLALGEEPFRAPDRVVSAEVGRAALDRLRGLLSLCDGGIWERNPIASHELVAAAGNTRLLYCPMAYGYSNYARAGGAGHRLTFGEPPTFAGAPLRTVLGGAGLAVSARRPRAARALAYARFVASPVIQRTLYTAAGGQPGHRGAWLDPANNRFTGDYFARTLPALDRAWVRPRHDGAISFQERAGPVVHAALRGTLADAAALAQLDALHRAAPFPP